MKTINHESDFKIIEGFKDGSSITAAPFRFTYYTKVSRGTYVAEYDGLEYRNCIPTEDGRVIVPFDSPKLGMGVLNVKREFFLNDTDFADGVCNLVSVESTGITLDRGATDDMGEVVVETAPLYHTAQGGSGIYETDTPPTELPADNRIVVDTVKNKVYVGLKDKGWWRIEAKPWSGMSVEVVGDTLALDGGGSVAESTLLLEDGSVTNNILTL